MSGCLSDVQSLSVLIRLVRTSIQFAGAVAMTNCPGSPTLQFFMGRPDAKGPALNGAISNAPGYHSAPSPFVRITHGLLGYRLLGCDTCPLRRCRLQQRRSRDSVGVVSFFTCFAVAVDEPILSDTLLPNSLPFLVLLSIARLLFSTRNTMLRPC